MIPVALNLKPTLKDTSNKRMINPYDFVQSALVANMDECATSVLCSTAIRWFPWTFSDMLFKEEKRKRYTGRPAYMRNIAQGDHRENIA